MIYVIILYNYKNYFNLKMGRVKMNILRIVKLSFLLIISSPIHCGNSFSTKVTKISIQEKLNYYKNSINNIEKDFYILAVEIEKIFKENSFYKLQFSIASEKQQKIKNIYLSLYDRPISILPQYKKLFKTNKAAKNIVLKQLYFNSKTIDNILNLINNIESNYNAFKVLVISKPFEPMKLKIDTISENNDEEFE